MAGQTRSFTLSSTFSRLFSKPYYLYDIETGGFFPVKHGTVLGRVDGDIRFPNDPRLSRSHLVFERFGELLTVRDTGTRNGTLLNDAQMIADSPYRLRFFDLLNAGGRKFVYTQFKVYTPGMENGPGKEAAGQRGEPGKGIRKWMWIPTTAAVVLIGVELASVLSPDAPAPTPNPASRKQTSVSSEGAPESFRSPTTSSLATARPASPFAGLNGWEAAVVEPQAKILRLREPMISPSRATALAFRDDPMILARIMGIFGRSDRASGEMPSSALGITPELESIADHACGLLGASARAFPALSFENVLKEIDAASGGSAYLALASGESTFGPLPFALISARVSSVRFPWRNDRIELASLLISCRTPVGKRMSFSEALATPFLALRARQSLAYALERQELERTRSLSKKSKVETLKGVRLSALIRASRNFDARLTAFENWMANSPEVAALLPQEVRQGFLQAARSIRADFQSQAARDSAEYQQGAATNPAAYPPIRPGALLEENELLYLKAD